MGTPDADGAHHQGQEGEPGDVPLDQGHEGHGAGRHQQRRRNVPVPLAAALCQVCNHLQARNRDAVVACLREVIKALDDTYRVQGTLNPKP